MLELINHLIISAYIEMICVVKMLETIVDYYTAKCAGNYYSDTLPMQK